MQRNRASDAAAGGGWPGNDHATTHPKARIAGIALGHDAKAHDLPEFKQIFVNAVKWATGKN